MTQAVLEGVAFALRDSLEVAKSLGIQIERTKICGGGAKSPLWRKMIANIMNLKVDMIESEEGPALGGAMLAAVACGEYENVEAAAEKLVKSYRYRRAGSGAGSKVRRKISAVQTDLSGMQTVV